MRWWLPEAKTLRDVAEMPTFDADGNLLPLLPETPLADGAHRPYTDDIPVLFGHYWTTKETRICTPTTACVDLSAGKGGPLMAYQWCGSSARQSNFVAFPAL